MRMGIHETQPNDGDDGDDGFFQFGASVGVNDELRRSTEAEKEEIEQACNSLQSNIDFEMKLDSQNIAGRKHSIKEMDGYLRSRKEMADRLEVNTGALQDLLSTLRQELSTNDLYASAPADGEDSTIFDMSSDEGSFWTSIPRPENESLCLMKRFSETAKKKVIGLRHQMNAIQKNVAEQEDTIKRLNAETIKIETSIANEGLEEALEKSRTSTATKRQMLEDIKRRGSNVQVHIADSEDRLSKLQKEIQELVSTDPVQESSNSRFLVFLTDLYCFGRMTSWQSSKKRPQKRWLKEKVFDSQKCRRKAAFRKF